MARATVKIKPSNRSNTRAKASKAFARNTSRSRRSGAAAQRSRKK